MNAEQQLFNAASGALKSAKKKARELFELVGKLEMAEPREDLMPKVRAVLAELNQRVHEFNAYDNAVDTVLRASDHKIKSDGPNADDDRRRSP